MPTNLPPEALAAEQRYRAAQTVPEQIATLEEFISLIPKHKGTDKLRADLRKKLSKLKDAAQSQKKSTTHHTSAFRIHSEGAGQVVIVGPPNSGKSALVAALTHATPEVSPAPYSTWTPTPGMMPIDNIQVQIIDTPPLNPDYVEPELMELIRRCDLIVLLLNLEGYPLQELEDCLALLAAYRIVPPQHAARAEGMGGRVTIRPILLILNKNDDALTDDDVTVLTELLADDWQPIPLSVQTDRHVDRFKQAVFDHLHIMRVYSKPPGATVDRSAPFVLPAGSSVAEFAAKVHRDFVTNLKSARVWGTGVYDGQMVGTDHILHDGDIVELRA